MEFLQLRDWGIYVTNLQDLCCNNVIMRKNHGGIRTKIVKFKHLGQRVL